MKLDEIILPDGSIRDGWNFSDSPIELEPLNNEVYIHYFSHEKHRDSSIQVNLRNKTITPDNGNIPNDFNSFINLLYDEITSNNGFQNRYEKNWGITYYNKIKNALEICKDNTTSMQYKPPVNYLNFDPDYELDLDGTLNNDCNRYYAICDSAIAHINGVTKNVDKELFLIVESDDTITVKIHYSYGGKEYVQITRDVPNDADTVNLLLENQKNIESQIVENHIFLI